MLIFMLNEEIPFLAEAMFSAPIVKNIGIASCSSPFPHTYLQQSLPMTGVKKGCKLSTPLSIKSIKDGCMSTVTLIAIYLKCEGNVHLYGRCNEFVKILPKFSKMQ